PARPELVIVGQMIGGIGKAIGLPVGHKDHLFMLTAEHVGDDRLAAGLGLLAEHGVEDGLGFSPVVENAGAVAPAVGGEEKGGDDPLLAVGGGADAELFAFRRAVPGEKALARPLLVLHKGFGPSPEAVELGLLVQL